MWHADSTKGPITPHHLVLALQTAAKQAVRENKPPEALPVIWPADYPRDPALAARRTLTDLRIGWLNTCGEAVQLDTVDRIQQGLANNDWAVHALNREVDKLCSTTVIAATAAFRELAAYPAYDVKHVVALLGTVALEHLSDEDVTAVLFLARCGDLAWQPFVIDALTANSERLKRPTTWKLATAQLLAIMEDRGADAKQRLNSALFALRRVSGTKTLDVAQRTILALRIAAVANDVPFAEHAGLRRELRRLGLLKY